MQNLIQFLLRHGVFFLFLLLEALCFYLVVKTNQKQSDILLVSSNVLVGKIYARMDGILEYWHLSEKVDSLSAENARLKRMIYSARAADGPVVNYPLDSALLPLYTVIPAHVINNSVSSIKNYLTLDKGSRHGLKPGMGVIDDSGIVGVVSNVSSSFARVLSILHSDAMISASIKRNHYFGSLVWKGFNPRRMYLEAIPKHAEIFVGDTVVTSGFSEIFPSGILIGVVEGFRIETGSNFYTVSVRLFNDLSNIQQAYAIDNALKEEKEELEEQSDHE